MAAATAGALEDTAGQRADPGSGPEGPEILNCTGRPVHSNVFSAADPVPADSPLLHATSASPEQQRPSSGIADNIRRALTTQLPRFQRLIVTRRSSRHRRGSAGRLPADISAHAIGALPPHPTFNTRHRRGSVATLLGAGDAASSRAGDLSVHSCATSIGGTRRSLFTVDGLPEPVGWGPDVSIISIHPVTDAVPAEPYFGQHGGTSDLADSAATVAGVGPGGGAPHAALHHSSGRHPYLTYPPPHGNTGSPAVSSVPPGGPAHGGSEPGASAGGAADELPSRQQLTPAGVHPGSSAGTGGAPLPARTPHSGSGYQPQPGSSSGVGGSAGPAAHSAAAAGGDPKSHSSAMHPYLAESGAGPVGYRLADAGRSSTSGQPTPNFHAHGDIHTHTHTHTSTTATATPSGPGSSATLQPHGPDSDVPLGRASWGDLVMRLNRPESAASGASPPFPSGASPPIPSGAQPSSYPPSEVGASPSAGAGAQGAGVVPEAVRRLVGPGAGAQSASGAGQLWPTGAGTGAAAGAVSAFGKHQQQQQQQAQEAGVSAGPESGLQQQQEQQLRPVAVGAPAEPSLSWDDPRNPMSPSYDPSLDDHRRAAVQGAVQPAAAAVHQPHHHHQHAPALHVHFPEGYHQQQQQHQQWAPGDPAPQGPAVTVQLGEPGKGNTTGSVHAAATGATYAPPAGASHPTATAPSTMTQAPYTATAAAAGTDPLSRVSAAANGTTQAHTPSRPYTPVSAGGVDSVHSRPAAGLATDSIQSRATAATGAAAAASGGGGGSIRPDGSCRRLSRSRHSDVARVSRMTDGTHIVVP